MSPRQNFLLTLALGIVIGLLITVGFDAFSSSDPMPVEDLSPEGEIVGNVYTLRMEEYILLNPADPFGKAAAVTTEQDVFVTPDGDWIPLSEPRVVDVQECPPLD